MSCPTLSIGTKLKLVRSLILPSFDYCCDAYNDLPKYLETKLSRLLNCAIRFAYNLQRHLHITPYRLESKLLCPKIRRLYFIACLFYTTTKNLQPKYLADLFPTFETIRRSKRTNIASSNFLLPRSNNDIFEYSFQLTAVRLWNLLPASLRNISCYNTFKSELMEYLRLVDLNHSSNLYQAIYYC